MAGNPLTGEVEFKVGDKSYPLRLGPKSALLIQKECNGDSLTKVIQSRFGDPNNVDFEDVVTVMWAAMQRKDHNPTRDEVIDIIDAKSVRECVDIISALFVATFGSAEGDGNPPKASPAT